MTGISIIICTYNGELRLPITLEYISKLRFEGPWELLIVDNASKDNSNFIAQEFFKGNPIIQGKVVFEPNAGLTHARQKGWRTANYDIVLFCDDDN
nr:glycosyltransferase family 2 protein [Algoriphagus sp.]